MDNQHRKIIGYRELNQKDIDLMNAIKALGPQIEAILLQIEIHIDEQIIAYDPKDPDQSKMNSHLDKATPKRFLELAKTDLQTGLMYATRAVAQPEFF